jgi:hypothetical protein
MAQSKIQSTQNGCGSMEPAYVAESSNENDKIEVIRMLTNFGFPGWNLQNMPTYVPCHWLLYLERMITSKYTQLAGQSLIPTISDAQSKLQNVARLIMDVLKIANRHHKPNDNVIVNLSHMASFIRDDKKMIYRYHTTLKEKENELKLCKQREQKLIQDLDQCKAQIDRLTAFETLHETKDDFIVKQQAEIDRLKQEIAATSVTEQSSVGPHNDMALLTQSTQQKSPPRRRTYNLRASTHKATIKALANHCLRNADSKKRKLCTSCEL